MENKEFERLSCWNHTGERGKKESRVDGEVVRIPFFFSLVTISKEHWNGVTDG